MGTTRAKELWAFREHFIGVRIAGMVDGSSQGSPTPRQPMSVFTAVTTRSEVIGMLRGSIDHLVLSFVFHRRLLQSPRR